jgi:hypothetical protein
MAFRIERDAEPIPGYRLLEPLGRGGFGEVWKAEAPGGILKAIKFVFGDLDDLEQGARGAEQEMKSLARVKGVRHPFLLSLERFDVIAGQLVIVTELADCDLWDRFRDCRGRKLPGIPREELLRYMEEAAEVLDLMNARYDLQHMDIKPQNLCLVYSHVKVADFGLVKDLSGRGASVTGGLTPSYAPPETFQGQVSRFSDQYSLAIVYQELLTGQLPFTAANPYELMVLHTEGAPNLEPLPKQDRAAVGLALAKDPNHRHASCAAFARALRESDGAQAGGPPPPPPRNLAEGSPTRVVPPNTLQEACAPPSVAPVAVEEETGDGVLFPALVIGLGRFGLEVLRKLRHELHDRAGGPDRLPHLQLLGIETDPESADQAFQGGAGEALRREEVLLTRLSRVSHYLRPQNPLPPLDEWLPPKAIYRIPRSLTTDGHRALGRLAFVDHYRSIVNRLRRELGRVAAPEALRAAAEESGLGLRSNWPRVYVAASLAGGTGSGMFVDLAYVVRAVLRERGYTRPEVIGLFLLPPADDSPGTARARANSCAALVELHHFGAGGEPFQARYDATAPPLQDAGPPFSRAVLLTVPSRAGAAAARDPAGAAAGYLYRELLTPLGREAERAREAALTAEAPAIPFQTFGMTVLASPRRRLFGSAAQRLGQALLDRWTRKGLPELGTLIRQEIQEQLRGHGLDPQSISDELQAECARKLGKPPENTIAGWIESVADARSPWSFDPPRVPKLLRQVDQFLGAPEEEGALQTAPVPSTVREAAEQVSRRYRQALADLIAQYLDRPGYRLAGAAEAVNQSAALVERVLQLQESQVAQSGARVRQLGQRLQVGLAEAERALHAGKRGDEARLAKLMANLAADLAEYPRARYRQILLLRSKGLYLGLRGYLSDQVRDIRFLRQPLEALRQSLAEPGCGTAAPEPGGPHDAPLLPDGCSTPDEVADRTVQSLAPGDWLRLDQDIQDQVHEPRHGLTSVGEALRGGDGVRLLRAAVVQGVGGFLSQQLTLETDVAELFLAQQPDEQALTGALQRAFAEASPVPAEGLLPHEGQVSLLVAPASAAGERVLQAACRTAPGIKAVAAGNREEIVFYREYAGLTFEDLERLGLACPEAYAGVCSLGPLTPHARTDVFWTGPVRR